MSYKFTEEQLAIRDLARSFAQKEVEPLSRDMDEHGWNAALYEKYKAVGLQATPVPEAYGGAGLGDIECAIITQELARADAGFAMASEISWVCTDMIIRHGSDAQKQKYLPGIAEGKLCAFGLTEPDCGSDAAGMRTRAKKQADGSYVVNGSKAWITNSGIADYYVIMAVTDPDKRAKGISAFLVDAGTPGLLINKEEDKMGMRSSDTHGLTFDDMKLPPDALLGEEGMGFVYAMEGLDGGRISCTAISTGIAQHAMALAMKYAKERAAFGKPIAKFQAIAFKLANMAMYTDAMELMLYDAAELKSTGVRCSRQAAEAKLFASTHATQICLDAIQIFGGNGYSKEYHVEQLLRDNKLMEIGEGTNEVQRIVISGALLK
ncbi:acyl-CoA dehydrogenase family protein [uncultured Megasphaera sp.]|uniref:acyl-CoA dehydrogenase family protein n=1 Tax=uncultured Megasphaera sp. TaxID=165188 RepID=UPI002625659F|nr:acyl-CoA dehydrogenase family protein [uncultured Megasphaera sp.]